MNWIKKRYDQFVLALLAIVLLACAVLIFLRVQSFGDKFSDAMANVPPNNKVPPVVLDRLDQAKEKLQNPPAWTNTLDQNGKATRGSLFVSEHYIIGPEGTPKKPDEGALYNDSLTGKPIPNKWFLDNGLPLLTTGVALQDPDKDGFTNEDEWRAAPPTDPNNKESHPPYISKLFLKRFEKVAFRLVFKSYDGDPKKDPSGKTFDYQIDTLDLRQPSDFVKMGDMVPKTKFKLEKFEYKTKYNDKIQENEDASELTLADTETGDKVVLIYNKVIDSPDVFANFEYEWKQPTQMIRVKKLGEFVLQPEVDDTHHYKLIDITDTEAQIELPNHEKYTVTMDPRHAPAK